MNTNDKSPVFPVGRCDLKPVPSVEDLQSRIQELEEETEMAAGVIRDLEAYIGKMTRALEEVRDYDWAEFMDLARELEQGDLYDAIQAAVNYAEEFIPYDGDVPQ